MNIEQVRAYCLSFPHATENLQWGNDLVFKIAGKMFAVLVLEGASKYCLSFKCTEEKFAELIEQDGIDPAPYSARYHWVAFESVFTSLCLESPRIAETDEEALQTAQHRPDPFRLQPQFLQPPAN